MSWIGGDEQNGTANFGKLNSKRARGCSLSYTSFPADKDPAQRLLVEEGLECGLELIIVGVNDSSRHDCAAVWEGKGQMAGDEGLILGRVAVAKGPRVL